MTSCVTDEKTGEKYGWGRVLDYIGVGWTLETNPLLVGQLQFKEE